MEINQIPYAREQANKLLETGECDMPLTFEDVARRVANNPTFPYALRRSLDGDQRMMDMITITAANELCKEFDQ